MLPWHSMSVCHVHIQVIQHAVVTVKWLNGSSWFHNGDRQPCIRWDNGSPGSQRWGTVLVTFVGQSTMYLPLLVKEVPISIVVGLLTYLDKSVNMRAWLKVNNDSLVDMGMWTHWTVLQLTTLLYAQRWTCIVDTLSVITTMCTGQTGNNFHEV